MGSGYSKASGSKSITKGDYEYTKNGANVSIRIMDVKGDRILARVGGVGPNGALFNGNLVEAKKDSEMIKGMKKVNTSKIREQETQQKLQRFREQGFEVKNSVPKGYVKEEGAVTAPNGYTWYSNNKSRFSGERKIILVKDKRR